MGCVKVTVGVIILDILDTYLGQCKTPMMELFFEND